MFNKKQDERFKRVYADGGELRDDGRRQILVDTETGVHYLVWKSGYAGGITPLLDSEGNVVITPLLDSEGNVVITKSDY